MSQLSLSHGANLHKHSHLTLIKIHQLGGAQLNTGFL